MIQKEYNETNDPTVQGGPIYDCNSKKESVILPEETSMGASWECRAVDAAEKDGKYYVYLSNGGKETYVVESDNPGNGWRDPLGRNAPQD